MAPVLTPSHHAGALLLSAAAGVAHTRLRDATARGAAAELGVRRVREWIRHMDGPPIAAPWRRLQVYEWRRGDGSTGFRVRSRRMRNGTPGEVCEVLDAVSAQIVRATVGGTLRHVDPKAR